MFPSWLVFNQQFCKYGLEMGKLAGSWLHQTSEPNIIARLSKTFFFKGTSFYLVCVRMFERGWQSRMLRFGDSWPRKVPSHSSEVPPNSQSKGSFLPRALDLNLLHCLPLSSGLLLPKDMGKLFCTSEKMRGLVFKRDFCYFILSCQRPDKTIWGEQCGSSDCFRQLVSRQNAWKVGAV